MNEYLDFSFDDQFINLKSEGLKYLPYVGASFNATNPKVLIVGESVYNWGENNEEKEGVNKRLESDTFAREVAYGHGIRNYDIDRPFVRNIERFYLNKKQPTENEKIDFWKSIAFHEFVQRPMSSIKERPNNQDYKLGGKLLIKVIEILKIENVIFLGTEQKKIKNIQNVMPVAFELNFAEINRTCPKVLKLDNSLNSKIYFVKHPSSFFSWEDWGNWYDNVKNL